MHCSWTNIHLTAYFINVFLPFRKPYIFKQEGDSWSQQAKLIPADPAEFDQFGSAVSISGDYAVVGAPYHDGDGTNAGATYIFKREGDVWTQQVKLNAYEVEAGDHFGFSVSIKGNYVVVGAWGDDDLGENAGAVYVFRRLDSTYVLHSKILAADGDGSDYFGSSVAVSGDSFVVGANGDDLGGSAYIFKREDSVWVQQVKLMAAEGGSYDEFGNSVAMDGDFALVGARGADYHTGAVYLYERDGDTWVEQTKLLASDGMDYDGFGSSVAVSGIYAAVGLPNAGQAYLYTTSFADISAENESLSVGEATTLSWNFVDADTVTIDNGIGVVTESGEMVISPTETTTYTITATGSWGTVTDTVTVTVERFYIWIDSPQYGGIISRPDVKVEGGIYNPLGIEIGVTVNGILAVVDGNQFVANHIPLEDLGEGANTITVTAVDVEGNTDGHSTSVYFEVPEKYITMSADPQSGIEPFETVLRVEGPFNFAAEPSITHIGPDAVEYLDSPDENEYNIRISTPGIYYFTAEVEDDEGQLYTDAVAIEVISFVQKDGSLKAKWNGMRTALGNGAISQALSFISKGKQDMYAYNFNLMNAYLSEISAGLQDIDFVQTGKRTAEYEMWAEQDGQMYSWYILFVRDSDGIWRIEFF